MSKKCSRCGKKSDDSMFSCGSCGAPLYDGSGPATPGSRFTDAVTDLTHQHTGQSPHEQPNVGTVMPIEVTNLLNNPTGASDAVGSSDSVTNARVENHANAWEQSPAASTQTQTFDMSTLNGKAIGALLVLMFGFMIFPIIPEIIAISLGRKAINEIDQATSIGQEMKGRQLAKVTIVIASFLMVVQIIGVGLFLIGIWQSVA